MSKPKSHRVALEESEERYRVLFRSGNDAIFVYTVSPGGTPEPFAEVNDVACQMLGYSRAELLGLSPLDVRAPEGQADFPRVADSLLHDQRLVFETVMMTKAGDKVPVEVSSCLFRMQGRPAILSIARDITERKRMEETYRSAIELAEAASRAKSEFVGNMSHELRTPLNSILGYADLLLDEVEGPLTPSQRTSLERLRRNAGDLLRLVDDLLDFSIAESGRTELQPVVFDVRSLVSQTTEAFATRARRKGLDLSCRCSDSLPSRLWGDVKRLRQVLGSLIDNAIKFTETGAVEVTVGEEGRGEDGVRLHFAVRDTGIGVSKGMAEEIFRAFVQVNGSATRRHGGAGLGLAIARHAVELMGGQIWVESEREKSTTFHFTVFLQC